MPHFKEKLSRFADENIPAETVPEAITDYIDEEKVDGFKEIRKKWDPEKEKLVDKQIRREQFVEVEDKNGDKIKLEMRFLNPEEKEPGENGEVQKIENPKKTLVIISGWGSSYKRLSETAKVIALESNRPVILMSMPGVGNSDDPPESWIEEENFGLETDVAIKAFEKFRKENGDDKKDISLLGYSMGGLQAATIAAENPELVKNLVMMHAAGVKKEPTVDLVTRFILNGGFETLKKFEGYMKSGLDKDWLRTVEKQTTVGVKTIENIMTIKRFKQHFGKEIKVLANAGLLDIVKDIVARILIVSGSSEKLFPPEDGQDTLDAATSAKERILCILRGQTHTSPMLNNEMYGALIAHYLDKFEEADAQDKEA
jgi:pimeloyl-ACP methyl ester carboxylesterase